jgi:hypothetical protein
MARMIDVKVTGAAELKKNVEFLRAAFPSWLNFANEDTARRIRDDAKNNVKEIDAYDTHALYNSIKYNVSEKGLSVVVYSDAKHAPFIEFGTAPHFPPIDKIKAWCKRKNIPESAAFPIARAISERGTPERPWLYPAYKAGMRDHVKRIRDLVTAALQKQLG